MNAAPAPAQLSDRFRHIVIEGPIGVGKSSLARRLALHLGAELLLEAPEDNPFLGRFYDDMPGYAFQTQLFFLFQRAKQMQAVAQPGMFEHTLVSDFLFARASDVLADLGPEAVRIQARTFARLVTGQIRETVGTQGAAEPGGTTP